MHEITELLRAWKSGDMEAFDRLKPLVDPQLKRIASNYLRDDRARNNLKTTTLVHEALIRLIKENLPDLRDRKQFYGFVAKRMRQVLTDEARRQRAAKRGNRPQQVDLSEAHDVPAKSKPKEIAMLDEALVEFSEKYKRKAEVVEYRFFIGLSVNETAEVMGLAPRTVERDWEFAQAWLQRYMTTSDH
jgi:RNA polymerase sigma factor (TIGR02999 family)